MKTIFTITTIQLNYRYQQEHQSPIVRQRTIGFFENREQAEAIIDDNIGDIYEAGYYDYVVLEELKPGIYSPVIWEQWYKWENGYEKIPKPGMLHHYINFAMG